MADNYPNPVSSQKRLRPKTYSVAVYVVGLFIVLELVALACIFWFRQSIVETEAPELTFEQTIINPKSPEEEPVPYLPSPKIDRLPVGVDGEVEAKILKLNEEAKTFRRQGDFVLAEAALNEALSLNGNHAFTLTNMAMLEEARGNVDKALILWKSLLGLKTLPDDTMMLAKKRAELIESRMRLEEEARQREKFLLKLKREIQVAEVKTSPDPLPERPVEIQKDFILKLNGLPRPVDPSKLRIQLFFYDSVGENRLAPASIEARFVENPPNWEGSDTETLRARYFSKTAKAGEEARSYYGYVLRIFYNGELQEETAEPISLLHLFPQAQ